MFVSIASVCIQLRTIISVCMCLYPTHLRPYPPHIHLPQLTRAKPPNLMMIVMMIVVTQHIPTITKSHHGGEMLVMMKVGMCQCQPVPLNFHFLPKIKF